MVLELDNVHFTRGGFALSANLSIAGAGVTAIVGPSGGGKSTLLELVAGFSLPDVGLIRWNGSDLTQMPPGERPVSMLFQDNNLFPHLDCLTNVALGAEPVANPKPETHELAQAALIKVGLAGTERRKPGALSGGQQSRVALARLLLTNRPVILMDEPFSALGPSQRRQMLELVKDLLPDATLLMVSHDPQDAHETEQTILVVDGIVSPPSDTKALFANPPAALENYLR